MKQIAPSAIFAFFESLAERFSDENALSDFTYAIAKGSPAFMKVFIDAFWPEAFRKDKPYSVYREIEAERGNRSDFIIEQGSERFIVENKIWDRTYHFKQYCKAFPKAKRGFISAYKLDKTIKKEAEDIYGFKAIQWKNFVERLEQKAKENNLDDASILIEGYIRYVREVCGVVDLKPVKQIKGVTSLHSFLKMLTAVIADCSSPDFQVAPYGTSKTNRAFGDEWAGKYMHLKHVSTSRDLYPLYGISFSDREALPKVCIWFERDWNASSYDQIKLLTRREKEGYIGSENSRDGYIELAMKAEMLSEFDAGNDLDAQIGVLKAFLDHILQELNLALR